MPALQAAAAIAASSHRDVEPPHHRATHNIFLILAGDAFPLHCTPAVAASRGQWNRDLLIHPVGKWLAGNPAIFFARLAARPVQVRFRFPSSMRGNLPSGSPQSLLQLLPQPFDLLPGLRQLFPRAPVLPFQFRQPPFEAPSLRRTHPSCGSRKPSFCQNPHELNSKGSQGGKRIPQKRAGRRCWAQISA